MILHLLSLGDLPSCLEDADDAADDGLWLLLGTFNGQSQYYLIISIHRNHQRSKATLFSEILITTDATIAISTRKFTNHVTLLPFLIIICCVILQSASHTVTSLFLYNHL